LAFIIGIYHDAWSSECQRLCMFVQRSIAITPFQDSIVSSTKATPKP
jgi:hypothetical protein